MNAKPLFFGMVFLIFFGTVGILANGQNALEIADVQVSVEYEPSRAYRSIGLKDSFTATGNNTKLDIEVYPGATLFFEVGLENTFPGGSDNASVDIADVIVTLTLHDINDDDDIEVESSSIEVSGGSSEEVVLKATVPQIVAGKDHAVTIRAEGEGEDNKKYVSEWKLTMPVGKISHDIRFSQATLQPSKANCGQTVTFDFTIYNAGRNAESDLKVAIENTNISIRKILDAITLSNDVDDENIKFPGTLTFDVPDSILPGTYPLAANIYWQNIVFNTKQLSLEVGTCDTPQPPPTTLPEVPPDTDEQPVPTTSSVAQTENPATAPPTTSTEQQSSPPQPTTTQPVYVSKEFSFKNSPYYLPVIIGGNLVIFITFIAIGLAIAKRRKGQPPEQPPQN